MDHFAQFYIDGAFVSPREQAASIAVIDPATEEPFAAVPDARSADVENAVRAARSAFADFALSTRGERLALLRGFLSQYDARGDQLAEMLCREMGAPLAFAREAHVTAGRAYLESTISALEQFQFDETHGTTHVTREAIGVCALITPWNWPLTQIICKVAPALAAGCTMVLKPSEVAPLNAVIIAEALAEAGVPKGVFNLVQGTGHGAGQALAAHPDVDMVSFTGSTRAGILVAQAAAPTVKRVSQELGGKSPNIILDDAGFAGAVAKGVARCFINSGQSCSAPSRMLVPAHRHEEALAIAAEVANAQATGDPRLPATQLGPLASATQWHKVQDLIASGIDEGAVLAAGGPGRPAPLARGFYARPTVFGAVTSAMRIAREEIFGPVLCIMRYRGEDEAVSIANDTPYGLAAFIHADDLDKARSLARRLRAGQVLINNPPRNAFAPFGGYKQSGNGRERAGWGVHEFLEIKAIVGYGPELG